VHIPGGWHLCAWPISMHEVAAQPLNPTGEVWVQFDRVSFEGLTSFFAFEILAPSDGYQQRFVLNFPLVGAPENRREHVLRMLLRRCPTITSAMGEGDGARSCSSTWAVPDAA